mgnify:CR=1 FL=1
MGTVLKIAAGVLLGLLAYQAIIYLNIDYQQDKIQQQIASQRAAFEVERMKRDEVRVLRNKRSRLVRSIKTYYRKNKTLPEYVSELSCVDRYKNKIEDGCAVVYDAGVFYVNHGDEWLSVEPYVIDNKVYDKCKATISLSVENDSDQECAELDISSVPARKSPPFDCGAVSSEVEKIICASDKLIAHENKLSLAYKTLLEQNTPDKKQKIIDDQHRFMELRRSTCSTSGCIEEMTSKKILRLELLGVWKKEAY